MLGSGLVYEHGINPLSSMTGCLPLLIQLPIIWAFYQSISRALAAQPGEMLVLSQYLSAVPGFLSLVPLPNRWLMFDLSRPVTLKLGTLRWRGRVTASAECMIRHYAEDRDRSAVIVNELEMDYTGRVRVKS